MSIRVLYVEDSLADVELFKYECETRESGFYLQIAESMDDVKTAIKDGIDVVVSDFNLTGFSGIDVLHYVKDKDPEMPVIFLSSSIGEERAAFLIREGSTDFILKQNISKIPLVVKRAFNEKINLRQKEVLQNELKEKTDLLDTLVNSLTDMIYQRDCDGRIIYANKSLADFFHTTLEHITGKPESFLFDDLKSSEIDELVNTRQQKMTFVLDYFDDEGKKFILEVIKSPLLTGNTHNGIVTVIRDVTAKHLMEKEKQKGQNILKQAETQTGSGSYEFDLENDVLHISPNFKRIFAFRSRQNVISFKKLLSHIYPDDRKLFREKFESCLADHIDMEMEHRYYQGSDKNDFRYGKTVMKVYRAKNEISFYGTITDNTAIREASLAILDVQERERAKISKELHDNVGQKLSAASMMLNIDNKDPKRIKNLLDVSIQDIRNLSRSLNTPVLNSGSLEENLQFLIENLPDREKIDFEMKFNDDAVPDFIKGQVYRMLQEGINNALKYSEATRIVVKIETDNNILVVRINDDGKGFDMDEVKPGNGIHNIRERVKNCSGELKLFSMPENGTKIAIKIPVNYA